MNGRERDRSEACDLHLARSSGTGPALRDKIPLWAGIGASGAIAGVLGAYLVLYPKARVATLIPLGWFSRVAEVPAVIVLGFWFVLRL